MLVDDNKIATVVDGSCVQNASKTANYGNVLIITLVFKEGYNQTSYRDILINNDYILFELISDGCQVTLYYRTPENDLVKFLDLSCHL